MFFAETLAVPDPRCHVVRDESELAAWEQILVGCADEGMISWDTETSGHDWWGESTRYRDGPARIISHCFGFDRGNGVEGVYLPIRHLTNDRNLDPVKVTALAQNVLGDERRTVAMQNGKYDIHQGETDGIEVRARVHDTLIGASLLDENQPKDLESLVTAYGVAPRAHEAKDVVKDVFRELCKQRRCRQKDAPGYAWIPVDVLGPYGARDAIHTLALARKIIPWVEQSWGDVYALEMRLMRILQRMERKGMPLDIPYLHELDARLRGEMEWIEKQIHTMAGRRFSIGSDERVRELLYGEMKQPVKFLTKGKGFDDPNRKPAVDATALMDIIHRTGSPIARAILDYRERAKVVSTYTVTLANWCDSNGVLHGTFSQVGTVTGRFASKDPNLQNMPSSDAAGIRRAFLVPPGRVRIFMDFSQVELRVLAYLAREPSMISAFVNGEDIHAATSRRMFGQANKANRRIAKVINFGVAYGMSQFGVRDNLNKAADPANGVPTIDENQAEAYLDQWHGLFPRVKAHIDELVNGMVRHAPPAFTNIFGRTRRIQSVATLGSSRRRGSRQAIASEIQGTAAELTKVSIDRAHEIIEAGRKSGRYNADLVGTIHDEVIADVDRGGAYALASDLKAAMQDFPQFAPVPIICDGEWSSTTWADKTAIWPEGT